MFKEVIKREFIKRCLEQNKPVKGALVAITHEFLDNDTLKHLIEQGFVVCVIDNQGKKHYF